jgi:hypothetical protein
MRICANGAINVGRYRRQMLASDILLPDSKEGVVNVNDDRSPEQILASIADEAIAAFNAELNFFEFGLELVVADILRKRTIRELQELED